MASASTTTIPSVSLPGPQPLSAEQLENYIQGPVNDACARFYVYWRTVRSSPAVNTVPAQHRRTCDALASRIEIFAVVVAGLSLGTFELQMWQFTDAHGNALQTPTWGVVRAENPQTLGFAVVPYVVAIIVGTALGAAWALADLYLTSRKLEAESDRNRTLLAREISAAIAAAAPADRDALAASLARANRSVADLKPQGFLDRLGATLSDVGGSISNAARRVGGAVSDAAYNVGAAAGTFVPLALLGIGVVLLMQSRSRGRA